MLPIPEENLILIFSDGVFDCGKYVKENSAETGFKGGGNPISARLMFRDAAHRPRGALLQADIGFRHRMYRIGGRRRNQGVSFGGVDLWIPPFLCWNSNLVP